MAKNSKVDSSTFKTAALVLVSALLIDGCAIQKESFPTRTATEQLLISASAERAAKQLVEAIPHVGKRIFVDTNYFQGSGNKPDSLYAISTIRAHLINQGAKLVADKAQADLILEIRSGALSMDERQFLIGIPESTLPVPFAGSFNVPQIALFSKRTREGVASFAGSLYASDGITPSGMLSPQLGYARETQWRVLLLFGWKSSDYLPEKADETSVKLGIPRRE